MKLIFEYHGPVEERAVARMWVKVSAVAGATLIGTLANDRAEPNARVKHGDTVTFARAMLIDIDWAVPDCAPPPTLRRDYWDRCMVDGCILAGEPVDYLYREAADMTREGDRYPDSGWRIRAAPDAIERDESGPEYIALGKVLNRDDRWLHLIDAAIGSAFQRGEHGTFQPVD